MSTRGPAPPGAPRSPPHDWPLWLALGGGVAAALWWLGPHTGARGAASAGASAAPPGPASFSLPAPPATAPRLLHVPDGGDRAPDTVPRPLLEVPAPAPGARRCPPEMVDVAAPGGGEPAFGRVAAGRFCIDRYEARLVRADDGRPLSPYYPPTRAGTRREYERARGLVPKGDGVIPALPQPPAWQLTDEFGVRATAVAGQVPSGYVNHPLAEAACAAAGKRLCSSSEWVTACRGQAGTQFPYGNTWVAGRCNVFREAHPAAELHGDASRGHLDPRLNLVTFRGKPLLRPSGATPACASAWGDDAVHDLVGNLDEWVAEGGFQGGFYARSTKAGCDARISSHPDAYYDYSLGVRCCR